MPWQKPTESIIFGENTSNENNDQQINNPLGNHGYVNFNSALYTARDERLRALTEC